MVRLALGAALFAVGLALGQTTAEKPKPGGTFSFERTLPPATLAPPRTVTVTVTTG